MTKCFLCNHHRHLHISPIVKLTLSHGKSSTFCIHAHLCMLVIRHSVILDFDLLSNSMHTNLLELFFLNILYLFSFIFPTIFVFTFLCNQKLYHASFIYYLMNNIFIYNSNHHVHNKSKLLNH